MSIECGNCSSGINPSQMMTGMGDRFKTADTDGSEAVSKQEFVKAMEDTGFNTNKMEKMFSKMDSNGDGEISHQEQLDMMSMMEQRMGSLMGSGGSGRSQEGFDSVTALLESLQRESDNDDEQQMLQEALEKMRSKGHDESAMSESLSLINGIIPGINTSA